MENFRESFGKQNLVDDDENLFELNKKGKPVFEDSEAVWTGLAVFLFSCSTYFGAHLISYHFSKILLQSPLLKWTGFILSFIAAFTSGVFAYLIPGAIFGQWDYAKAVFYFNSDPTLQIALAVLFFAIPFVRIISKTLYRMTHAIKLKRLFFSFSLIAFLASTIGIVQQFQFWTFSDQVYLFCFCTIGLFSILYTCSPPSPR